jgi:hypothetical protein
LIAGQIDRQRKFSKGAQNQFTRRSIVLAINCLAINCWRSIVGDQLLAINCPNTNRIRQKSEEKNSEGIFSKVRVFASQESHPNLRQPREKCSRSSPVNVPVT